MNVNQSATSFIVENSDIEKYSLNLVHYFIDKQDFAFINFQEKILENFNHDYYNIIYIYSSPLINDVNIEALSDKLTILKKNLRKQFYLFNQQILLIATNCTLDLTKIVLPKDVAVINATEKEKLFAHEIIKELFSDLITYPLELNFPTLAIKLNEINIAYAKKISTVFNKKQYFTNILFVGILALLYFFTFLNHFYANIPLLTEHLIVSQVNLKNYYYYTLITNSFVEVDFFWLIISIFFIITLGIRLEKTFGSIRYIIIMILSMLLTNAINFGLLGSPISGFIPIVYTFVGVFIYVVIIYRRFLAHMIKRLISFSFILLFLIVILGDYSSLFALTGALISGFVSAFIIGVPKTKNGNKIHRILSLGFVFILISLLISLGFK
jgi:rhomboid protease GluP